MGTCGLLSAASNILQTLSAVGPSCKKVYNLNFISWPFLLVVTQDLDVEWGAVWGCQLANPLRENASIGRQLRGETSISGRLKGLDVKCRGQGLFMPSLLRKANASAYTVSKGDVTLVNLQRQLATPIRNACFSHKFADIFTLLIAFKNFQRVATVQISQKKSSATGCYTRRIFREYRLEKSQGFAERGQEILQQELVFGGVQVIKLQERVQHQLEVSAVNEEIGQDEQLRDRNYWSSVRFNCLSPYIPFTW